MSRRNAIAAAVEAYNRNRVHPIARLPRPAARLLVIMFDTEDVCCASQETLRTRGFGKALPKVLHALVAAGFVSRQAGMSRTPDTYRLRLPEAQP